MTPEATITELRNTPPCLIIIRGTPQGHRYLIEKGDVIIGRDEKADLMIADQGISRKHAMLSKAEGKVQLTDLGSSNGTYVNDKKIPPNTPVPLAKEDMIKLGTTILKYLPAGELEAVMLGNLASAAHTDALTKIYNKGYLLEVLEAEFKRAKALHTEFSIVFFDLDHFKKVNDTYGHDAGDFVLKEFCSLIKTKFVREKDVFARYGGEEFVLLLPATNKKTAAEIAEKMRATIEGHTFMYNGEFLPVTTSLGVADLKPEIDAGEKLLKNADRALYHSKHTGRNKVSCSP